MSTKLKHWTKKELSYFNTTMSNDEIAEKTGRTYSAVQCKRHNLIQKKEGAPRFTIKFWTPEELDYFQQGLSNQEISDKIGRDVGTVQVKKCEIKKKGMKTVMATAIRMSKKVKTIAPKKVISEKVIAKAAKAKVIASTDLHFVVNGLNLYVANTCTNVLIGKNKVEVNF